MAVLSDRKTGIEGGGDGEASEAGAFGLSRSNLTDRVGPDAVLTYPPEVPMKDPPLRRNSWIGFRGPRVRPSAYASDGLLVVQ